MTKKLRMRTVHDYFSKNTCFKYPENEKMARRIYLVVPVKPTQIQILFLKLTLNVF